MREPGPARAVRAPLSPGGRARIEYRVGRPDDRPAAFGSDLVDPDCGAAVGGAAQRRRTGNRPCGSRLRSARRRRGGLWTARSRGSRRGDDRSDGVATAAGGMGRMGHL